MTVTEVAKVLDLHPDTVRRLIREGKIDAEKKGRSYDIPPWQVNILLHRRSEKNRYEQLEKSSSHLINNYENEVVARYAILFENIHDLHEEYKHLHIRDIPMDFDSLNQMSDTIEESYEVFETLWRNNELKDFFHNVSRILKVDELIEELRKVETENRTIKSRYENELGGVEDSNKNES